jgi:hypothetical protein
MALQTHIHAFDAARELWFYVFFDRRIRKLQRAARYGRQTTYSSTLAIVALLNWTSW